MTLQSRHAYRNADTNVQERSAYLSPSPLGLGARSGVEDPRFLTDYLRIIFKLCYLYTCLAALALYIMITTFGLNVKYQLNVRYQLNLTLQLLFVFDHCPRYMMQSNKLI